MIVVMLITAVETTGDVFATGEIVEKRITKDDIAAALRADGLATTLGGVFNSFPYTCFAENVGLVRLTRVRSRYVVVTAGFIMIIIGLIPKAGAIVASIPPPGARRRGHWRCSRPWRSWVSRPCSGSTSTTTATSSSSGRSLGLAVLRHRATRPSPRRSRKGVRIIFGSGITLGSLVRDPAQLRLPPRGPHRGPAVAGAARRSKSPLSPRSTR